MPLTITRKSAPQKVDAVKKAVPRRRPADEDEAEATAAPAGRRRRPTEEDEGYASATGSARGGWGEAEQTMAGGGFAQNLALKDGDEVVIRFLEDQPYASFRMHWLDRTKGKRSYACVGDTTKETAKNGCPFCEIGVTYRSESRFNVALLTDSEPIVKSWTATPKLFKKVRGYHDDKRYGPLSKLFYYLRREGTGLKTEYTLEPARSVKDIGEFYSDLYIPSKDELADLHLFTVDQANKEFASVVEMRKAARELLDDADD